MELDIVEEKNGTTKIVITLFIFIGLVLVSLFAEEKSFFAIMSFAVAFSFLQTIESLAIRKLGKFVINEEGCQLKRNNGENIQFPIGSIKCLLIDQNSYLTGIFSTTEKIILKISIQQEEAEVIVKVLLRGKREKEGIISTLKKLYKNNVCLKEYDINGNRSFLFKTNLNYKEIQEIKKDYNLSWQ